MARRVNNPDFFSIGRAATDRDCTPAKAARIIKHRTSVGGHSVFSANVSLEVGGPNKGLSQDSIEALMHIMANALTAIQAAIIVSGVDDHAKATATFFVPGFGSAKLIADPTDEELPNG